MNHSVVKRFAPLVLLTVGCVEHGAPRTTKPDQVAEAEVRGRVLSCSQSPIANARVIGNGHITARSDGSGAYILRMDAGHAELTIDAVGYADSRRDVDLEKGGVSIVDWTLPATGHICGSTETRTKVSNARPTSSVAECQENLDWLDRLASCDRVSDDYRRRIKFAAEDAAIDFAATPTYKLEALRASCIRSLSAIREEGRQYGCW